MPSMLSLDGFSCRTFVSAALIGHTETIEYEDDNGKWHTETASGRDRPHTVVKDVD
jgi:hypothetical protein